MRRLLLLCVPLSLCFIAGSRLSADDAKTKDAATKTSSNEENDDRKWKSLFDGKSLAGWKVPNFGTQGEVEVEDGQIHLGFGDGCTGVTYTKDFPKWNYEVSCDAMRVDGNDFFCGMTFRVGDDPCSFIPGGWGGTVVGLSTIDGYDAANNSTSSFFRFKDKTWYTFRVRVTKERIQCFIDKEKVVDQELEGHKISIRSEVELSRPFGIASWKTASALKNIKVRLLEAGEK
jgi:3-keto-disaccharide hydrolase